MNQLCLHPPGGGVALTPSSPNQGLPRDSRAPQLQHLVNEERPLLYLRTRTHCPHPFFL